jgi:hypothetical protein
MVLVGTPLRALTFGMVVSGPEVAKTIKPY